jgi:enamine deaminase RidA (YjgF/YER057c/UK114 family)
MANVQYLNPETIPPPIGNGYTHVVKIGPWVYIAGQVGGKDGVLDPDASVQADIVYTKLRLAMESVGGRLNDLVATTTYVTDPENGQKVREVRGRYFGDDPPASTFINIQQLARPEILLEIDAVGYLEKNTDKEGGETMADVQRLQPKGMSPTNNRYSHVVKIGPWVYIAGQTAADENGDVAGIGDPKAQVNRVFKNLSTAMESVGGQLSDIIKTTVYVVGTEHMDAIREARAGKFGDNPPTSTLIVVSSLARPEFMLEIEAVGYVGS